MKNGKNAQEVLESLQAILKGNKAVTIRECYRDLNIFDWWTDNLSVARQKEMERFLKLAIELGYTGYVCFKVGASGCANGMWAHKEESTTGYSPEGEVLYRSFTYDYTCYDAQLADGSWLTKRDTWNSIRTQAQLKKELAKAQ